MGFDLRAASLRHSFLGSLKACIAQKDLVRGCTLHAEIAKTGLLERDACVANSLISMYAKCGAIAKAEEVFGELPSRDIVSWNALITGHTQLGNGIKALDCFGQMQSEGFLPNAVTFVCILKACSFLGNVDKGQQIHAEIAKQGLLERNILVGTALVDMYAKCGLLTKAQDIFYKLPVRDIVAWSALIVGYAQHGFGEEALMCFEQMQLEGFSPDMVTFVCTLKACSSIGALNKGCQLHTEIARKGLVEKDHAVGTALVDMYGRCGLLAKAQEVFDKLSVRDIIAWNALVAGYTHHGHGEEVLNFYERMQVEGVVPDVITFVCVLRACGSIGAICKGQDIHVELSRNGLLDSNILLGNALVDMYVKCGSLARAQEVFKKLPVRDVIAWNAIISGNLQHGLNEEALNYFKQMQLHGISADAITITFALQACGNLGATDKGHEIHVQISKEGLEKDILVGNAVVDMYAKCGCLVKAQEVFDKLPVRNIISWNGLIGGYTQLGQPENVFHVFNKMIAEGIKPDLVTFIRVITACSHAGLVDEGLLYFQIMSKDYGINPYTEHHVCMLDLLGRAGQLEKAVALIGKMPFHCTAMAWRTVLGACRKWGNLELGRQIFEHTMQVDEKDSAAYVCMYNISLDAGMQGELFLQ